MSLRCMLAVMERYPADGGPGEKLLAVCLADNAHDDGTHVYPRVETMATRSLQSVRTVQRQLGWMLATGFLQLVKAAGGRGRPAEYRISPGWLKGDTLTPIPRERGPVDNVGERVTTATLKGDNGDTKRVTTATQKGDNGDTTNRTLMNLSLNHPPTPRTAGGSVDCGLLEVMGAYPSNRVDVSRSQVVWARLNPSVELAAEILEVVRTMARTSEWQRQEGRFAPKLSKWLRNRGWLIVRAPAVAAPAAVAQLPVISEEERAINAERARDARVRLHQLRASMQGAASVERMEALA